jgi:membrane protein required for colicin V production
MNYLDIIILVPLIWGIYKGFSKGLVVEVASLAALIVGVWCAIHFSELAADLLVNEFGFDISASYLSPVSFAVTFIAVAVVIVVVSKMIDKLLSAIALGGVNKFFGAIFGGLKTFLVIAILLYFVNGVDDKTNFISEEKKNDSLLYRPLVELVERVVPQIDIEEIKKKLPDFDTKELEESVSEIEL